MFHCDKVALLATCCIELFVASNLGTPTLLFLSKQTYLNLRFQGSYGKNYSVITITIISKVTLQVFRVYIDFPLNFSSYLISNVILTGGS